MGEMKGALQLFVMAVLLAAALGAGSVTHAQEPPQKVIAATGCVQKGVEAGCLLLVTADGKKYNIFAKPQPAIGTWIRIRGTRHEGPTICMEGIPVRVHTWKKLAARCPRRTRGS